MNWHTGWQMWKQNKLPRNCVGLFAKLPKVIPQNDFWIQQGAIHVTAGVILKMNANVNKSTSNSDIQLKLLCSSLWSEGGWSIDKVSWSADIVVIWNCMRVSIIYKNVKTLIYITHGKHEGKSGLYTKIIILGDIKISTNKCISAG